MESSKDYDRILYSTAFRRLGGVTQVVTASELGLFHNRLTHTLKTAQVGALIANHVRRRYTLLSSLTPSAKAKWKDVIDSAGGLEPRVVRAACLAHDLGHPPFGHIGEDELQVLTSAQPNVTRSKRSGHGLSRHPGVSPDYQLRDSFEGNAQSLRIITKLAFRESSEDDRGVCPALNLTKATLTAIMKYPWPHDDRPGDVPAHTELMKWGYYNCERMIAKWALDGEPYPRGRQVGDPPDGQSARPGRTEYRTLEAQVMDWSDDISYAVHDVEDFFRAGIIPLDDLADSDVKWRDFFEYAWGRDRGVGEKFGEARKEEMWDLLEPIRRNLFPRTPYVGSRADRESLHKFASSLIKGATNGTRLQDSGAIWIDEDQLATIEILKQLTWYYVIDRPSLESLQRGQRYVVRSLFRDLISWVEETWSGCRLPGRTTGRASRENSFNASAAERRQLPARLLDYLDVSFSEDEATGGRGYTDGQRICRSVIDYIVSLTEAQAVELCHRLTGRSLGSMLDDWVDG